MNVKFADLQAQYHECKSDIDSAIQNVLEKGDYILGDAIGELEKSFSQYSGYSYGVGVSSGTSAIELLLRTIPRGKDSEIVIPANTFIASVIGAIAAGFKVRLADVDAATQLVTGETTETATTSKTSVIMGVNLFGQCVDRSAWLFAEKTHRMYINDACQSHGVLNGNWFPACYSFYPAKNLSGIGDGGMVLTNDENQYKELLQSRNYGASQKYIHDSYGRNERLDTIQAAVLQVKLKHLDSWNGKRNSVAAQYMEQLSGIEQLVLPTTVTGNFHAYHLFVVRVKQRDDLQAYMKYMGIQTGIHYPIPIHKQKCYEGYNFGSGNSFPVTEHLAKMNLSLPMHPYLTESEVTYVCETIRNFYK